MRTRFTSILTALALAAFAPTAVFAQGEAAKPVAPAAPKAAAKKLAVGDTMPALKPEVWVQGEPVVAFDDGKTYLVECWATWCGPCVQIIPHVNALHNKFKDKGLVVIGLNVWENAGLDKVKSFVAERGEGMSYRVAYDGKTGNAASEILDPAGVKGIPHAFVVRDGKILWKGHPGSLKEATLEQMIEGKFDGAKLAREEAAESARVEARRNGLNKAMALTNEKKFDEALAIITALEKDATGDNADMFKYYRGVILVNQGAPGAGKYLIELANASPKNTSIQYLAAASLLDAESLKDQRDPKAAKVFAERLLAKETAPTLRLLDANADYALGNKEAALKTLTALEAETAAAAQKAPEKSRAARSAQELTAKVKAALAAVKEGKPWPAEAKLVK